jgi:hypothetical protein
VSGGLIALAVSDEWAAFWVVALFAVWYGIWFAFSAFWRWADETRRVLLRRRGYY